MRIPRRPKKLVLTSCMPYPKFTTTGGVGVPGPEIEVMTVRVWFPEESTKVLPETGGLKSIAVLASDANCPVGRPLGA